MRATFRRGGGWTGSTAWAWSWPMRGLSSRRWTGFPDRLCLRGPAGVRPAAGHHPARPGLARTSAQARAGGYTADMFTIDWDRRQATCRSARSAANSWVGDGDRSRTISLGSGALVGRNYPRTD